MTLPHNKTPIYEQKSERRVNLKRFANWMRELLEFINIILFVTLSNVGLIIMSPHSRANILGASTLKRKSILKDY